MSQSARLLLLLCALFTALAIAAPRQALAAATVTPATGGNNLSLNTTTPLGGPSITEGTPADVGVGNVVLQAPSGFQFDTSRNVTATVTTAGGSCNTATSLQVNKAATQVVTPTATTITVGVTRSSSKQCLSAISFSGIYVKATAYGSGNILKASGGSTISGVTNATNFGTLAAPAPTLTMTLSTNTVAFGNGLGPDGSPSDQPQVKAYPGGDSGTFYVTNGSAGNQAVSVTVDSSAPYTGSVQATENVGTAGMSIAGGDLRWTLGDANDRTAAQNGKPFSRSPDSTVFSQASSCSSGSPGQKGKCTFAFDYILRILWPYSPGLFDSTVTYTATQ